MEKYSRFFPLFVSLDNKEITFVGGGKIAERRIISLLSFGAKILVIAGQCTEKLQGLACSGDIRLLERNFTKGDIANSPPFLVVAATDSRLVNFEVSLEARESNVLCIVSDSREECDCYFPAIAENEQYIAGIVSKNGNHSELKKIAQAIRGFLENV